jgi:hypothetical protein
MNIDINTVKSQIRPIASGGSLNDVYRLLYHVSLLKYSTYDLLQKTHHTAFKVATKPKLNQLVKLGYINSKFDIYTANRLTIEILKKIKIAKRRIDIDLLPNLPEGYGNINELNNTEIFVQALNLDNYHCLLFPNFGYVRPDALLVLKQDSQYKLTFLEIEKPKSNWESYLDQKRINYLKLSQDIEVYNYWMSVVDKLGLSPVELSDFKFTVTIVSSIKKDWGEGFVFVEELS